MYRLLYFTIIVLVSCANKNSDSYNSNHQKRTIQNSYAKGYTVESYTTYKILNLHNPWDSLKTLGSFLLINKDSILPVQHPPVDYIIQTPVDTVAALSTTQIGMLQQLQLDSTIYGVTDPFRVHNKQICKRIETGEVHNLGNSMAFDLEKIVNLNPKIIFKSGFTDVKQKDKQLIQSGIPVVYISEWQEDSPLARSEWLKVFALFYEKEAMADTLFEKICKSYISRSKEAQSAQSKPGVMAGYNFKGTWYMPGGKSYMATLIQDAGGDYLWHNNNTSGSIPLGFEAVLEKSQNAQFWLGVEESTYDALLVNDKRLNVFRPFKEKNIYHRNKRRNEQGGNDYWESGIVRPDLVLSDFIKILHPELLPDYETTYYEKLQ